MVFSVKNEELSRKIVVCFGIMEQKHYICKL